MNIVEDRDGYQFKSAHGICSKCGAVGFHTKNIDYFGARTIYDFRGGCSWMRARNTACACTCVFGPDLVIDQEAHDHILTCKECQDYGF